jgi:hypothetical protein
MLDRDLIIARPSGRCIDALILPACYKMSNKLRILLSAHESLAFMVATHHESRTPAVTYRYQPKPPRLICFFGRTEGDRQASYQLTIHRNGQEGPHRRPRVPPREARTAIAGS